MTKKMMTIAMVPMIGPMEFSARVERKKAREATTDIDQIAAMKARSIRAGTWDSGMKTMRNCP